MQTPFRYDYVGSFLRPDRLKAARLGYEQGIVSREELKAVEDECIIELITKIKELGYKVITDGEFRRSWWHMDFFWGLNGIEKRNTREGLRFHDDVTKAETAVITGKIDGHDHPFVEHYRFVKQFEDENCIAKQTIPAPVQLLAQLRLGEYAAQNKAIYPDDNELKADIVKAYHQVIKDLYDAGCRDLQFDDCTWTLYADHRFMKMSGMTEERLRMIAEEEIELNNAALACKPEGMVINTHVCRGNFHSTYASEGAYDPIAPYLFAQENVDALYLEYDDARSGGFEPLKYVSDNKKVVLGLITTKRPELENKEEVIARIRDAAQYVPLERLCISTQCGFASTEEGNKLTAAQQWDKLKLIREIAEEVWSDC
ncbi:MAG: 5-methyltetrahydropteroyltriglutamate--homocysteine S-methyltransferase [Erysipelotrichaceae bacterium]|nr:5-methyltetrahydropteroyltriglutamate--homocysteine S-methyltransferase [Erysipelotrichaceae bacterium]